MLTIFLDIDGVLNKSSELTQMYSLNDDCIKEFASFCKSVNGKIVLSSSWREGFISTHNTSNTPQIKELEARLDSYGLIIADKTPKLRGRKRDDEIKRYLYFNDVKRYIIIDDDEDEYRELCDANYFVNSSYGFTYDDAKRIRKKWKKII